MRTVCIIQSRLGSARFPRKVLAEVCGKPLLQHVVDRALHIMGVDEVVIACPYADGFEILPEAVSCSAFSDAGLDENDVLGRFVGAAHQYGADVVIRVTGDCPLLDPDVSSLVLQRFFDEGADFASNDVTESGYPDGFDTEVFTRALLERAHVECTSLYEREHVTAGMKRLPGVRSVLVKAEPWHPWADLKLSVDTKEDLDRVEDLMRQTTDAPMLCECGCGKTGPGGRMEGIHPEDYQYDERA